MSKKTLKQKNIKTKKHNSCFDDFMILCFHDKRGMAALFTVIIISAAALLMAFGASMLGLGEMDMGYTAQKGQQSMSFVNGCAEESLRQLQLNANWPGQALNLNEGSCIIEVVRDENSYNITVFGTVDSFVKKLQVLAIIDNGIVSTTSWQEVEN